MTQVSGTPAKPSRHRSKNSVPPPSRSEKIPTISNDDLIHSSARPDAKGLTDRNDVITPDLRAPSRAERRKALQIIAESGLPTPAMFHSPELDLLGGGKLHIALENRHPVSHSIKDRAARVVVSGLRSHPRGKPIYVASSGNHAIAYAEACLRRGFPMIAVVPATTSELKVAKIEAWGASVVRIGSTWDDSYEYAKQLTRQDGGLFLDLSSPYSVAALGTAVHDMLLRRPFVNTVVLPGGGGTIASAARVVRNFEQIQGGKYKILIACPENAPTIYESVKAGRPVTVQPHTVAEAMNVATVDAHLLPEIIDCADDVVLVPDRWIEQGIPLLSYAIGDPVEAAGTVGPMAVLGSGGVLRGASGAVHDLRGQAVATMVTGGNIAWGEVDSIRVDSHVRMTDQIERPVDIKTAGDLTIRPKGGRQADPQVTTNTSPHTWTRRQR
ncbi:pyridoxal-phosphate dependent enzyme [Nocardia sp. NPDC049190]|uniref:pyridoxal-phosphate dependent enzyme n=1 Tax=Nocardia sp. NPDC049190 TaxID=3155650 RepID=UPI0033ED04A8